eukprot:gene7365-biopygen3702
MRQALFYGDKRPPIPCREKRGMSVIMRGLFLNETIHVHVRCWPSGLRLARAPAKGVRGEPGRGVAKGVRGKLGGLLGVSRPRQFPIPAPLEVAPGAFFRQTPGPSCPRTPFRQFLRFLTVAESRGHPAGGDGEPPPSVGAEPRLRLHQVDVEAEAHRAGGVAEPLTREHEVAGVLPEGDAQ